MNTTNEYLTQQLSLDGTGGPIIRCEFTIDLEGRTGDITANLVVSTFPDGRWLAATVPMIRGEFGNYSDVLLAIHEALVIAMDAADPF